MDYQNKIINRVKYSKYENNNNLSQTKNKNFTSYNISNRINTEINTNSSFYNRNKLNDNNDTNNKNNLLLMSKLYQNENKINNEEYKNNRNNININKNGIKRRNHYVFIRNETKRKNENISNINKYNNNEDNSSKYKKDYTKNQDLQNNIKQQSPVFNIQNYRKSNSQNIPKTKSFQSNIIKESKTFNNLINSENINRNDIVANTRLKSYRKDIVQKNSLSEESSNDNKKEEKENLMDIIDKQIGIKNLGNTCFINSSLQIFIHCPLFIHKLITKNKVINENTPITLNFLSICDLMLKTKSNSISIYSFKNLLGLKHKIFFGHLQQDSQEFIRIFLEDISKELNEIKYNGIYRLLSNSDSKNKKMRDEDFHINFSQREKSIITEIFYSQIVNIYTCQCQSKIFSFQKILDFPLLFPEKIKNNIISLYDLLKLYFSEEYIDFENKCEKCKKIVKHKKELKISRPPEILILSLQRIDLITGKKLDYSVKFEQKLNLYEFIDHECGYDKESKYELFGVINHQGIINSGHYFSFIINKNNEWIEFNDSIVRKINYFSNYSPYVYALFYIKEKYKNMKLFNS